MRSLKELTNDQRAALREQLRQALGRATLAGFIRYTYGADYRMGWVHEEICEKLDQFLQDVLDHKSPRLLLMMPPRHGKSEIVSKRFPAYAFGVAPDISIIGTSYAAELASRNNRAVQQVIESPEYGRLFPGTVLSGKGTRGTQGNFLRNSDIFEIVDRKGIYRSAGVGGGITGMGGNILLIDDPIKDRAEADSPAIRKKIYDWYTSTLYTRLAPGGGIIVIMTRWHMDDLCGRLLAAMERGTGDKWTVIRYEAIASRDEPNRAAGEALHEERYPLAELEKIKTTIGSRDWAALYQQSPTVDGGAVFKAEWWKYYTKLPPKFDAIVQSWDMAFKGTETSDYVVGQVWGRLGADFYLIDQTRGRLSFTETLAAFVRLTAKYPKALKKLVEDKANGPAVIDALKHDVGGIIPVEPQGGKEARAYAVTPLFEAGNVYIPCEALAPWVKQYTAEFEQFPVGANDDQVDATTQALTYLQSRRRLKINPAILRRW